MLTKRCNFCETIKPLNAFYKNYKGAGGVGQTCAECSKKDQQTRRAADPQKLYRLRRFNLSVEQYDDMQRQAGGVCEICKTLPVAPKTVLCIDHHHHSNNVRGLLCDACNVALGRFKDSISNLTNAIVYLKKYERKPI